MYDKDGDIVIQEVEEKLNKNMEVTKQDLVALTFTPVRNETVQLKSCSKLSFQITIKGENHMNYQIEEWPALGLDCNY